MTTHMELNRKRIARVRAENLARQAKDRKQVAMSAPPITPSKRGRREDRSPDMILAIVCSDELLQHPQATWAQAAALASRILGRPVKTQTWRARMIRWLKARQEQA